MDERTFRDLLKQYSWVLIALILLLAILRIFITSGGPNESTSPSTLLESPPVSVEPDVSVAEQPEPSIAEQPEPSIPAEPECGLDEELVDGQCSLIPQPNPVFPVRILNAELPPGEIYDCNNSSYVEPANDGAIIQVDLILGPAAPDGSVPTTAIFSGDIGEGPAVGEAWGFNNGEQFGFSSEGPESFCNYGVEPINQNLLQCDESVAIVGRLPANPEQANDFGTSFYTPNADDSALLASHSGSHSDEEISDGFVSADLDGYLLVGSSESNLDDSYLPKASCSEGDLWNSAMVSIFFGK